MFRFSVRDLLWLTLVVAVGAAWFVREQQFIAASDVHSARIIEWRGRTGALEHALVDQGWKVEWDPQASRVYMRKWTNVHNWRSFSTTEFEPSVEDD